MLGLGIVVSYAGNGVYTISRLGCWDVVDVFTVPSISKDAGVKRKQTSRMVGVGDLGGDHHASHFEVRPTLSELKGLTPWKDPKFRVRFFSNPYHRGAARKHKDPRKS